jgi:hypothetical protein
MKRTETTLCAALIALTLAGMASPSAWADGDKGKDKKKGPVVVVGPITTTQDPPKKK